MNTAGIGIEKVGNTFLAISTFQQKEIVKQAGFKWDPVIKRWWTTDPAVAAKVANEQALTKIAREFIAQQEKKAAAIESSRAADANYDIPRPDGLEYLPYQRAGIAYGLAHQNVLYGDEPGLGKTIEAIGTINAEPTLKRILVVCPASLKLNWRKELRKWLVRPLSIGLAEGSRCHPEYSDITIINYDICDKNREKLHSIEWDAVILDEAHYLKNPKAKRTVAIYGRAAKPKANPPVEFLPALKGRRLMALTGTPIPNKTEEGYGLFHFLAPKEFPSAYTFQQLYGSYGRRLHELQNKLRATFMVRRLKKDVLAELPAKRRSIIELASDPATVEAEMDAWNERQDRIAELRATVELAKTDDNPSLYKQCVALLKEAVAVAFEEMARVRHATAVAKIPDVIEHLRNCIDQGEKIICFFWHHDVINAIADHFGKACVKVYGPTPMAERQANVDRFQSDPTCTLIVGGFGPMGTGWTLVASSHVVFAELDWVPGNVTQAEDRAHRIGQHDSVLVEHMVLEGSLDARMAKILVAKQEIIDRALDVQSDEPIIPMDEKERPASEGMTREQIEKASVKISPAQMRAILEGLRQLTAMDGDRASSLNGMGFSKSDTFIGQRLSQLPHLTPKQAVLGAKLVNRYRKQLPPELVEAACL